MLPSSSLNHFHCQIESGLWLDARRAVWLSASKTLIVADLHLGYVWAQRVRGQLLPLGNPNEAVERLVELVEFYGPRELVLLGDIVHRAVKADGLKAEIELLFHRLDTITQLTFIAGNHDAKLAELLRETGRTCHIQTAVEIESHLLIHGDAAESIPSSRGSKTLRGRIMMGHEHPAIYVGDGETSSAKCPCFLIGEKVLVLPAFSSWAAGSLIGRAPFMSPFARSERFTQAFAILGSRLLPLPLP